MTWRLWVLFVTCLVLHAVAAAADPSLEAAGELDPKGASDELRMRVTIDNRGSMEATGVEYESTLDPGTTLQGVPHVSPIAFADEVTTRKETPLEIPIADLLANDVDPDGNHAGLTFHLVGTSTSQGGWVAIDGGNVDYTPPPSFVGTDTFEYQLDDGDPLTPNDVEQVRVVIRQDPWLPTVPSSAGILWGADMEEGNLCDFRNGSYVVPCTDSGGGVFNTPNNGEGDFPETRAIATMQEAYSGQYAAESSIFDIPGANRAVRLFRWTDTAWENGGRAFSHPDFFNFDGNTRSRLYYGGWWFVADDYDADHPTTPFFNTWQFKGEKPTDPSAPIFVLELDNDGTGMFFRFFSKENPVAGTGESWNQTGPRKYIPQGRWFHFECEVLLSTVDPVQADGTIKCWQDGVEIFSEINKITRLPGPGPSPSPNELVEVSWNTFSNGLACGANASPSCEDDDATLFFDDLYVSKQSLVPYIH